MGSPGFADHGEPNQPISQCWCHARLPSTGDELENQRQHQTRRQAIQNHAEQAILLAGYRPGDVGRQAKIDQSSCHKVEQNNQPKTGRRWIIGTRK